MRDRAAQHRAGDGEHGHKDDGLGAQIHSGGPSSA
jgi:hypothetical protein